MASVSFATDQNVSSTTLEDTPSHFMFWCRNIVHTVLVTNPLHIFAVGATQWARCDAWIMMQQWLQHYRALNLVTKGTGVQFDISSVIEPTASSDLRFVDQEEIIQTVLFCHSSWLCRDQVLCSAVVGLTKVVQPLPFESKSAIGHGLYMFLLYKGKGYNCMWQMEVAASLWG